MPIDLMLITAALPHKTATVFTKLLLTVPLLAALLIVVMPVTTNAAAKPNFVVIIADDLGANDLGAFGHPVIKTPHIDSLAQSGLRFSNAFLTTASCSASRASILTSQYPHTTGAPRLHDPLPADRQMVSTFLRNAGYYTAAIGKWHLGEAAKRQFDRDIEPPGDSGAENWLDELRKRPSDKPFFFWLSSRDPHVPYATLTAQSPYSPANVVVPPTVYDTPAARENIAQYYSEISRLDQYVGLVISELQTQGLLDTTYVIFLSDNGAPMPRAKTTLYDAGIRTPLIIRGPGVARGATTPALVSSIDLMPTVLALAGLPKPASFHGQDFTALLRQPQGTHRTHIFAEQFDHGFTINKRAVRDPNYLLIRNIGANKTNCILEVQPMGKELTQAFQDGKLNATQSLCFDKKPPEEELYDIKADPDTLHNLAAEPALSPIRHELRQQLDDQAKQTGDTAYFQ